MSTTTDTPTLSPNTLAGVTGMSIAGHWAVTSTANDVDIDFDTFIAKTGERYCVVARVTDDPDALSPWSCDTQPITELYLYRWVGEDLVDVSKSKTPTEISVLVDLIAALTGVGQEV